MKSLRLLNLPYTPNPEPPLDVKLEALGLVAPKMFELEMVGDEMKVDRNYGPLT